MSPIRCVLEASDDGTPLLGLSYSIPSKWRFNYRIEEVIHLQSTHPHFGGVRWWFSCPRKVNGKKQCGRRVAMLYRGPGRLRFACRHCLDLTYESCQKAHRYDALFARTAKNMRGLTPDVLRSALTPPREAGKHQKDRRRQSERRTRRLEHSGHTDNRRREDH
jgi:hypothetical protein